MFGRRFVAAVVAGAICAIAVVLWVYPSPTDLAISNPHWSGMRDVSREFRITLLTEVGSLPVRSRGTVLLVIPARAPQPSHLQALTRFVESGGVLILLDNAGLGNDVMMALGSSIRISGQSLADPLFHLKSSRLPKILDFTPSPLTEGVGGLVFNHASVLTGISAIRAVARSSPVSYLVSDPTTQRAEGAPRGPFSVLALESIKAGYVVAVADSSLVINSMLPQADNRRFFLNATGLAGPNARILLDDTLLPRGPLDVAKSLLADTRHLVSGPLIMLVLTIAALILPTVLWSKSNGEIPS